MPKNAAPSTEEIDELLRFLPLFAKHADELMPHDGGVNKTEDGAFVLRTPVYSTEVQAFFTAASKPCWVDRKYLESSADEMLENVELIAKADWKQIRSLLTQCVRGEHFCDGYWAGLIEDGSIVHILERMRELRDRRKDA